MGHFVERRLGSPRITQPPLSACQRQEIRGPLLWRPEGRPVALEKPHGALDVVGGHPQTREASLLRGGQSRYLCGDGLPGERGDRAVGIDPRGDHVLGRRPDSRGVTQGEGQPNSFNAHGDRFGSGSGQRDPGQDARRLGRASLPGERGGPVASGRSPHRKTFIALERRAQLYSRLRPPTQSRQYPAEPPAPVRLEPNRGCRHARELFGSRAPILASLVVGGEQHRRARLPGRTVRSCSDLVEHGLRFRPPAALEQFRGAREVGIEVGRRGNADVGEERLRSGN